MKPPAFQFYADDFLAGTADMTNDEVGAYIRLLCHQWSKGGLPNDPERLSRMAGAMPVPSLGYVLSKFRPCEDGLLRNDRLESERQKQDAYRAEQSQKGKKGAEQRWKNGSGHACAIAPAMPVPSSGQWQNDGSPSPSPSPNLLSAHTARAGAEIPTWDEVKALASMRAVPEASAKSFFDHHEGNGLWLNQFGKLINWQHKLTTWAASDRQNPKSGAPKPTGAMGQPHELKLKRFV